jgi:hypothetical protein
VAAWTYFNALQIVLGAGASTLIVRRLRVLLFEAPLDAGAFIGALQTALEAGQVDLARTLADACAPAWPARLATVGLTDRGADQRNAAGTEPPLTLEEAHGDLEQLLWKDRDSIVALGRIASPLAFIGVIIEAGTAFGGGDGLVALQRGLAASLALQRSLLMFALGVSTTLVCLTAAAIIQRQATGLRRDLDRVVGVIAQFARRSEM